MSESREDIIQRLREKSQDEIDKLLVYLSSGGLVLSIGVVDNIVNIQCAIKIILLKLSWWLFVSALIFTLFSHITSKHSMILELKGEVTKSDFFDSITKKLNWLSIITLCLGIFSCVFFITKNI